MDGSIGTPQGRLWNWTASTISAAVALSCALFSVYSAHDFASTTTLELRAESWNWWSGAKFRFEHKDEIESAPQVVAAVPSQVVVPPNPLPKAPVKKSGKKYRATAIVRHLAPVIAFPQVSEVKAELSEHEQMRQIHSMLRARFVSAMNTQTPVTTQIAEVVVPVPQIAPTQVRPIRADRISLQQAQPNRSAPQPTPNPPRSTVVRAMIVVPSIPVKALPVYKPSFKVAPKAFEYSAPVLSIQPLKAPVMLVSSQPQSQITRSPIEPSQKYFTTPAIPRVTPDELKEAVMTPISGNYLGWWSLKIPEAPVVLTSAITTSQSASSQSVTTQLVAEIASSSTKASRLVTTQCVTTQADRVVMGADAFNPSELVSIHARELTQERGPIETRARWVRASAPGHWPTLSRRNYQSCENTAVPMLSSNSTLLLAQMAGSQVQTSAGIIFGRVAAGWMIQLSGRAERPVVLDLNRRPSSMEATDRERYFAFLNVAPGAHLLYMTQGGTTSRGAVALPVVEGNATYMDLSSIWSRSFSGQIMDASSATPKGLKRVNIKAIGQTAEAETDINGRFNIPNVIVTRNYPVHFDTQGERLYTHRFTVDSAYQTALQIYMFDSGTIDRWLGQLVGGINPEGGLVIGAAPVLVHEEEPSSLLPSVLTISGANTPLPEAYTISAQNKLLVQRPLEDGLTRFIGVQVPEGVSLVELTNKNGAVRWSQWIYSSPGVVNMTVAP